MNVLIIAPHSDDEVLGAGGTIAKYAAGKNDVYVCVVTSWDLSMCSQETVDQDKRECREAHHLLGVKETFFLDLPAAMLSEVPKHEINRRIGGIIDKVMPQVVFIPHFGDIHSDHSIVSQSAMVGLRPIKEHRVLEIYAYETLSETEWNIPHTSNAFVPNTYVDISGYLGIKIAAMNCFGLQLKEFPHPRSIEGIEHLARYRGATAGIEAAEAFSLIRRIL
jgi:N-acetylglucosamine malate deacetylase 1